MTILKRKDKGKRRGERRKENGGGDGKDDKMKKRKQGRAGRQLEEFAENKYPSSVF